ncbi:MAG: hypothetical protein IH984_05305 [Planctomycetes bacterium]|nr:hypothetical protein [Planctomycetota bacterium]
MNGQIKIMIAVATMVCLLMADKANAQPECGYEVVIVHPDPCGPLGPPSASGRGINAFGHIAGLRTKCSDQLSQAFFWTPQTGMVDVNVPVDTFSSEAADIEGTWIVGTFNLDGDGLSGLGFLYDSETDEFTNLGTLRGGNFSQATAINSAGQVSGFWGNFVNGNPAAEAFIWENGRMTGLGDYLNTLNSKALAMNELGQVTGWMGSSHIIDSHAFIWDNGKVTELPFIPDGFTSAGFGISNNGNVAGSGTKFDEVLQDDVRHAFLWTDGKMIDLGVLPGRTESFAFGVNDARQVVGLSWDFGSNGAPFIWQNGVMSNLNDIVPAEFTIAEVWAINNEGMIAGSGNGAEGGFPGMALLIPHPRPVGDLDLDCEIDLDDLVLLLDNWGPCDECPYDLDGNGIVSTSDLLILFSNWG